MSLIRQAQRDYQLNNNAYYDIAALATTGNVQNPTPTGVTAAGVPTPATAGANIPADIRKYYSNSAFSVAAGNTPATVPADGDFLLPTNPVDFIVYADGSESFQCVAGSTTNCATNATQVNGNGVAANSIDLKMDNAGRIYVSYQGGAAGTWEQY